MGKKSKVGFVFYIPRSDGKPDRRYAINRGVTNRGTIDKRFNPGKRPDTFAARAIQGDPGLTKGEKKLRDKAERKQRKVLKEVAPGPLGAGVNIKLPGVPDSFVNVMDHRIKSDLLDFDSVGLNIYSFIYEGKEYDSDLEDILKIVNAIESEYYKEWRKLESQGEAEGSPILRFRVNRSPSQGKQILNLDHVYSHGVELDLLYILNIKLERI